MNDVLSLIFFLKTIFCTLCDHIACRKFRLKSHAVAKHGFDKESQKMKKYVKRCEHLSRRGFRKVPKSKLLSILGERAFSPDAVSIAQIVVHGLGYKITGSEGIGKQQSCESSQENQIKEVHEDSSKLSRRDSLQLLKKSGFVHSFVSVKYCRLAQLYEEFCDAEVTPANKLATKQKIHRYVDWAVSKGNSEFQALRSKQLATDFCTEIARIMKPNSVRNHCAAITDLITVLTSTKAARREIPKAYRSSLQTARFHWNFLKKRSEKKARVLQRRKMVTTPFEDAPGYLAALYIHEKRKSGDLEQCLLDVEAHRATDEDARLILSVLAAILCLHGQRKVSALALTFEEICKASYHNGRHIVRIQVNKTSDAFGPSVLGLKRSQYDLFKRYGEARHCAPGDALLTNLKKKPCRNYLTLLEDFVESRRGARPKLFFNSFRKTLETNKKLGASTHDTGLVSSYLSHSPDVSRKHYEFKTDPVIFEEAQEVESIWFQLAALTVLTDPQLNEALPKHCLGKYGETHCPN